MMSTALQARGHEISAYTSPKDEVLHDLGTVFSHALTHLSVGAHLAIAETRRDQSTLSEAHQKGVVELPGDLSQKLMCSIGQFRMLCKFDQTDGLQMPPDIFVPRVVEQYFRELEELDLQTLASCLLLFCDMYLYIGRARLEKLTRIGEAKQLAEKDLWENLNKQCSNGLDRLMSAYIADRFQFPHEIYMLLDTYAHYCLPNNPLVELQDTERFILVEKNN